MKRLIYGIVLMILSVSFIGITHGQGYQDQNQYTNPQVSAGGENINLIGTEEGQQDSFISVVKGFINRTLGILALIALIIVLYGGFLMVTASGDEEKYKKGFTILRQAAIGLILIGVARFIVSIIFWLVNLITVSSNPAGTGGG